MKKRSMDNWTLRNKRTWIVFLTAGAGLSLLLKMGIGNCSIQPAALQPEAKLTLAASISVPDNDSNNMDQFPFRTYNGLSFVEAYETYVETMESIKTSSATELFYKKKQLWMLDTPLPETIRLEAPVIYQMPELERGCEVTSLAMLLQYAQVNVDKMTLAEEIVKDSTPFEIYDHKIHFGNPNNGFVGNMVTFDEPGYGVYHHPVAKLAEHYLPGNVVDATGAEFNDILRFLQQGAPVWVIANMEFRKLADDEFERWETPDGPIDVTFQEHSALITGYDSKYIYINDPLGEYEQVSREEFEEAWGQMGKQAISYIK